MAHEPVEVVEVRIWGQSVGALSAFRGGFGFQYSPLWKKSGSELSPLLMPLSSTTTVNAFPRLNPETFYGLPPMIADALPDRFGNSLIDAWLASQGIDRRDITPLDRLAYLGDRGMGALEFVPDRAPRTPQPTVVDLTLLMQAARSVVVGSLADERGSLEALEQIISVGTSAGGARAKAVVNINEDTHEIRPGHDVPADGERSWVLKFDGVGVDRQLGQSEKYTRIEYAYSLMARAAGIRMPDTRLLHENGRSHFLAERFDREAGQRIHMQSLCGIDAVDFNLRRTNDYGQLFTAMTSLGLGDDDRNQVFTRMAFNVAAANHDDHSKNHSFLLRQGGTWELAPGYDITYARDADNVWLKEHLMGVNGRFSDIGRSDLLNVADRFAVPSAKLALIRVSEAVSSWTEFAREAGLDGATVDSVAQDFITVA